MAIDTKSLQEAQANWQQVTPQRAQSMVTNAVARVAKWATNTVGAIPSQQMAAVGASVAARITRKVQGRGQAKYVSKLNSVGMARFSQGVGAAGGDYATGFGPSLQVIQSTTLPPKGPKGDPRNIELVRVLAENLHRAKLTATASGT